ncbi:unnamed protein product [Rotaria sp. Silwood1]|nr:unnamed protein product [Rotaria sp. Silwood1]CAF1316719.1 unnamed protein product [Rotaria sp. Silwood1]CAF3462271.1 unnamed protein product [Rotaria sp. Silwood1]CAF3504038.1 unnamed protein product [Rotaria sp. Silwood1]CAF3536534.1 unnamed protein product [Rotaria sp. Silwood1]
MKSRGEQLPVELWLLIFSYIEVHDLFQAFSNLNNYFDKLLASKQLFLNVQLGSKTKHPNSKFNQSNFYWSNSILDRVTCIQSFSEYESDDLLQFLQSHSKKLIQLKSLIIQVSIQNIPSICSALEQFHSLHSISLTCIPSQKLLEIILLVPTLRICRLRFWRPISIINYQSGTNSNVEILYIQLLDDPNHSISYLLLSHMPKLKRLEIEKCRSVPLFNQEIFILEHLQILKFIWNRHQYKSDYFEHCHTVVPYLKSLYLTVYYFQFDEAFDINLIDFVWTLLKKMKSIKIFILCNQLMTTVNNNIQTKLDTYCQQLSFELNTRSDAIFQIKRTEEKAHKHKIQIISQ